MNNRILFIEATSGASGDMLLGAFLDLGVPIEVLSEAWTALGIDNYEVEIFQTSKSGLKALQCKVRTEEGKGPRSWKSYENILKSSKLQPEIKSQALRLCRRVFEVEADFHQETIERLHLHEMGGTDLLIDVVGCLTAADYLKANTIYCSPINTGRGFVQFSHGTYPIPAPATSKLLEGAPVFQNEVEGELCTPTGALLLTHLASKFGPMPQMNLRKTGTGAGERDTSPHPNVLRIFEGDMAAAEDAEQILMLESNIDDSNPQILSYFMDQAFQEGALDVFFTPVFMKKNRPAVRVSVLVPASEFDSIVKLLFAETTAIGLRYWSVDRRKLDRRWVEVKVSRNTIRIKEGYLNGRLLNYQPEFEDCRAAAEQSKKPVKVIISEAVSRYLKQSAPSSSIRKKSSTRRRRS